MTEPGAVRMEVVMECPVLETRVPWPVADAPPYSLLRLWGGASMDEVGLVAAQLVIYNRITATGAAGDVLRALAASEELMLPGGVRVTDAAGNVVGPGCCSGVEEWHEWLEVDSGGSPWMGHDPYGWVEHETDVLRVCSGDMPAENRRIARQIVIIPRAEIRGLVSGMRRDLEGFAARLHDWAVRLDPEAGAGVAARFSANFISPPPPFL